MGHDATNFSCKKPLGASDADPKGYGLSLVGLLCAANSGCMGLALAANVINAVKGYTVDAEFKGLREKRVAVVTLTDSSQYSDDASARILSRRISDILRTEVKDIELVREDEVQQWRDRNGGDAVEFLDIGRGVKADKVLGVELTNLKLRDGAHALSRQSDRYGDCL